MRNQRDCRHERSAEKGDQQPAWQERRQSLCIQVRQQVFAGGELFVVLLIESNKCGEGNGRRRCDDQDGDDPVGDFKFHGCYSAASTENIRRTRSGTRRGLPVAASIGTQTVLAFASSLRSLARKTSVWRSKRSPTAFPIQVRRMISSSITAAAR